MTSPKTVTVSGAGPAGMAAALRLHQQGWCARVFERRNNVGTRFHGDFQGLENWTSDTDILHELRASGIETDFDYKPFHKVTCFDPQGRSHHFNSQKPLFYLIRRGQVDGSLDNALKHQLQRSGAELYFGQTVTNLPDGGIVTHGPQQADVIAAGYLFDTDMADGAWAAVSDDLAPKGYAYVLVVNGKGTLASCMYADFHRERDFVSRCVEFFERKISLTMQNPRRFGGVGNAVIHQCAHKGNILYAGEAAGLQDALFGFGMRWAMLSGVLAADAQISGQPDQYEQMLDLHIRKYMKVSEVNRWIYRHLGNRGYCHVLNRHRQQDAREWMQRGYRPRWWTPVAHRLLTHNKKAGFLRLHPDCDCTWCKCRHHIQASS